MTTLQRPDVGVLREASDKLILQEKISVSITHNPTVKHPGQGRTIGVVGDVYRFLATGDDTNGKYAIWEAIVPPGG